MKTQKRYQNEAEILATIDRYRLEAMALDQKAFECERKIKNLLGTNDAFKIEGIRHQICQYQKQIEWRNARLLTLGDRLSEMRTYILPGIEPGDGSVASV